MAPINKKTIQQADNKTVRFDQQKGTSIVVDSRQISVFSYAQGLISGDYSMQMRTLQDVHAELNSLLVVSRFLKGNLPDTGGMHVQTASQFYPYEALKTEGSSGPLMRLQVCQDEQVLGKISVWKDQIEVEWAPYGGKKRLLTTSFAGKKDFFGEDNYRDSVNDITNALKGLLQDIADRKGVEISFQASRYPINQNPYVKQPIELEVA